MAERLPEPHCSTTGRRGSRQRQRIERRKREQQRAMNALRREFMRFAHIDQDHFMPEQPVMQVPGRDFVQRLMGGHRDVVLCVARRDTPARAVGETLAGARARPEPAPSAASGAVQKQRYSAASTSRAGSLFSEYQIV